MPCLECPAGVTALAQEVLLQVPEVQMPFFSAEEPLMEKVQHEHWAWLLAGLAAPLVGQSREPTVTGALMRGMPKLRSRLGLGFMLALPTYLDSNSSQERGPWHCRGEGR